MARNLWQKARKLFLDGLSLTGGKRNHTKRIRALQTEQLERREVHAVNINYDAVTDALSMVSDAASDRVEVVNEGSLVVVKVNNTLGRILGSWAPVSKIDFTGNDGDDTFINSTSIESHAWGGRGNDTLTGGWGVDRLHGGDNRDTLIGRGGDDILRGDAGDDTLAGHHGRDFLYGGTGDDELYGGAERDHLYGGTGNNHLEGGQGNDLLWGGVDSDFYFFSSESFQAGGYADLGIDEIVDMGGKDSLDFRSSAVGVKVDLAQRETQVVNPYLKVKLGDAAIEVIVGSRYNDLLIGNDLQNTLYGLDGDDRLYGRAGADELDGGNGDDGLFGGRNWRDILRGGSGDDRFLLASNNTGPDQVLDFKLGEDATAEFRDGGTVDRLELEGRDPNARWNIAAGTWTDAQVETVDGALANMQYATGNTRLFSRYVDPQEILRNPGRYDLSKVNKPLVYYMHGAATLVAGTDAWGVGGWNSGSDIHFVQDVDMKTVYHEIGHEWDEAGELGGSRYDEWKAISGWSRSRVVWNFNIPTFVKPSADHVLALANDTILWVKKDAAFSRSYGRLNPQEDMATTFEAYFSRHGNIAQNGLGQSVGAGVATSIDAIPLKKAFLDRLFASLR